MKTTYSLANLLTDPHIVRTSANNRESTAHLPEEVADTLNHILSILNEHGSPHYESHSFLLLEVFFYFYED